MNKKYKEFFIEQDDSPIQGYVFESECQPENTLHVIDIKAFNDAIDVIKLLAKVSSRHKTIAKEALADFDKNGGKK